jgi:cytochrome c oxidase assembly protein subunit 15
MVAIIQVLLGTQIRSALEVISNRLPLASAAELLNEVGAINHLHMLLGFILAVFTWVVGYRIIKQGKHLSMLFRQSAAAAVVLVSAQIIIGLGFFVLGIPAVAQVFHLWVASLLIGALLVLFSAAGRETRVS